MGAKAPCCPQGLGWYQLIARSQPSLVVYKFISLLICSKKATDNCYIFRHTLIGIKLNKCDNGLPQVFTSLLSKAVLNFVIKEMKGFCGSCGLRNEGTRLNPYSWFVAIKEISPRKYHTGMVFEILTMMLHNNWRRLLLTRAFCPLLAENIFIEEQAREKTL